MLVISLPPALAEAIYRGEKLYELRKGEPRSGPGARVAIYETSPGSAITGTFVLGGKLKGPVSHVWRSVKGGGIPRDRFERYFKGHSAGVALRISSPRRLRTRIPLDRARELEPYFRPPQSFAYVDDSSNLARTIESEFVLLRADQAAQRWFRAVCPAVDSPSTSACV